MSEFSQRDEKENAPVNWSVTAVLGLTFLAAITVVPWYGIVHGYSGWAWLFFAIFMVFNGIGIGSGYHRLWSHRTYQAHPALSWFLAVMGGMALQNSIIVWSARHRIHHRDVDDNDKDPYSIGRGFWFAHIGWMLRDYDSGAIDYSVVRDLEKDPVAAWQHRWYWTLVWTTNVAVPLFLGWLTGDMLGMFLLVGVLRLVLSHHVTFFINSLAHMWGKQPYTDENTARDHHLIALLTYGEGYHNYHHLFQSDYRCGIRWWHLDINKWFISTCALLGLAKNRKRAPAFKVLRARLNMEFKVARQKLEQEGVSSRWREQLETEYAQFVDTIKEWQQLQMERVQAGRQKLAERFETETASFTSRYRELEMSLKMQHKRLALLTSQVM
ncbi:MAG: fatty acid desaturase [Xanthomonadales bacterium]|jgi:stearoyl-CoA desaturase (delta-9 desaturase)|nr:fatty acid desaturase [Xanthomonadales bacterium]MDH3923217.1 fatty acid desaturase [Xanthomonadales bacterium]MDH3939834.1 fatty acid desaturase [Xanthomonadales bacterium]MDH4000027.1 fatty acid desaturase [Xanthomonadales bacterium]